MKIKGIKVVAGASKQITDGYKGAVIYDKATQSTRFVGTWRKDCDAIIIEVEDTEVLWWIYRPMTMKDIKNLIG